ncbi:hypothetical protein GF373_06305 [bacterium]|nr:hypothetical protein [bacterium]
MDKLCKQYQENYGMEPLPRELAEHANVCPACRQFAAKQDALQQMLSSWETPAASSDFDMNVMARIAEHEANRTVVWDRLVDWFSARLTIPAPVGVGVIILLFVSFVFNLMQWNAVPTRETPTPSHVIAKNGNEEKPYIVSNASQSSPNVVYSDSFPIPYSELLQGTGGIGVILIAPHPLPGNFYPYTLLPEPAKKQDSNNPKVGI